MKSKVSRILSVSLVLVLAMILAVGLVPVSAKTLEWFPDISDTPELRDNSRTGKTCMPGTNVMALEAGNDGKTMWAVVTSAVDATRDNVVMRSPNGGISFLLKSPTTAGGAYYDVSLISVAPDDPMTCAAAGLTGAAWWVHYTDDGGETWTSSDVSAEATYNGNLTCLDLSVERDDFRWLAVGTSAGDLFVCEAETFRTWEDAADTWDTWYMAAAESILALAWSPQIDYDDTLLALTSVEDLTAAYAELEDAEAEADAWADELDDVADEFTAAAVQANAAAAEMFTAANDTPFDGTDGEIELEAVVTELQGAADQFDAAAAEFAAAADETEEFADDLTATQMDTAADDLADIAVELQGAADELDDVADQFDAVETELDDVAGDTPVNTGAACQQDFWDAADAFADASDDIDDATGAADDIDDAWADLDNASADIVLAIVDIRAGNLTNAQTDLDNAVTDLDAAWAELDNAVTDLDNAWAHIDTAANEIDAAANLAPIGGTTAEDELEDASDFLLLLADEVEDAADQLTAAADELEDMADEITAMAAALNAAEGAAPETFLQLGDVADEDWNTVTDADAAPDVDYPAEVGNSITATVGSLSVPDSYYGTDSIERNVFVGTDLGCYRMEDVDWYLIRTGNVPVVAYKSDDNKLLVGYGNEANVVMTDNPDAGSPSFERPGSMKRPSGTATTGVTWLDSTMMCSTSGPQSGVCTSLDADSWNGLALLDHDLDNIYDMALAEDGSKTYLVSQDDTDDFFRVFRYASRWESVLCYAATAGNEPIIRLAPGMPEVAFLAITGTQEIRRTTDEGQTWKQSRSDVNVFDMVAKDDKIVVTVAANGYCSTSKDGGRTFADWTKSNITAKNLSIAPNGELLVCGNSIFLSQLSAAYSTDDGASWKHAGEHCGVADAGQSLIVADKGYTADNRTVYVAQGDDILRWTFGGGEESWDEITSVATSARTYGLAGEANPNRDDIFDMQFTEDGLYIVYSDGVDSGFTNTIDATGRKVYWSPGSVATGAVFNSVPQALHLTSGSTEIAAVDTSGNPDAVWTYTDPIGAVGVPILTGPADSSVATVDEVLEVINPITFSWQEVHELVEYELRLGTDKIVVENFAVFANNIPDLEFVTITWGPTAVFAQYPFAAGETYYWKVRVSAPVRGPWSETRSFTVEKKEPTVGPPPQVTVTPPEVNVPEIVVPAPVVTVQPAPTPPTPAYVWVIIVVGALLVVAVIILIVRTRRVT